MPSIGETLREARMRQHLDIADVEARTKIRAKYLRALENEEFGLLPGSTFVRTFLRTYAELLGLDSHRLVEEYRTNYEPRDEGDLQPLGGAPAASGRRERPPRTRPPAPSRLAIVAGAVGLLLVFLIILGLTGGDENGGGGNQSANTQTEKKPAKKPKRKRPAPAPSGVSLRVVPVGPTYVCLDNGPGTAHIFEGTISEPQTFKGKKIRINLGRTSGQLFVNGRPFRVAPSSTPVGYEFSTTGSKQIPPQQRPCVA